MKPQTIKPRTLASTDTHARSISERGQIVPRCVPRSTRYVAEMIVTGRMDRVTCKACKLCLQ